MQASVQLDMGKIVSNLKAAPAKIDQIIGGVMQREAVVAENWMKSNAPWQDQTTNARNGLTGQYAKEGAGHSISLFHRVPYGIWLEVKYEGRNAIVLPALREFAPRVMSALSGTLNKI